MMDVFYDGGVRAVHLLLQHGAPLPAAITAGELARRYPDDARVWLVLGVAVARSAGRVVRVPFQRWSGRCLARALALDAEGELAPVAREWMARLAVEAGDPSPVPATPAHLDRLLRFLDIDADLVVQGVDALPPQDVMFAVMMLGDLAAPRCAPVIAAAISGRWGDGPARSALKRTRPSRGAPEVVAAIVALRASALGEACEPYLSWAESQPVPPPPPTVERGFLLDDGDDPTPPSEPLAQIE